MYEYSIENGLKKVVADQVQFLKSFYDVDEHESLSHALGFDILQDSYVLEDACEYNAQDYSVAIKLPSSKEIVPRHGRNVQHFAIVEVHCYGSETIIFVKDALAVFEILSDLLNKQSIIRNIQNYKTIV